MMLTVSFRKKTDDGLWWTGRSLGGTKVRVCSCVEVDAAIDEDDGKGISVVVDSVAYSRAIESDEAVTGVYHPRSRL